MKTKPVLITWGVDLNKNVYMDCYFEIDVFNESSALTARTMELRSRYQMTEMALFQVPQEWGRSEVALCIQNLEGERLRKARVTLKDLFTSFNDDSSVEKLRRYRDRLPLIMGYSRELDKKIEAVLKE